MISFLKGAFIGLILVGWLVTSMRGFWWLYPAAILIACVFGYIERAILPMKNDNEDDCPDLVRK